MRAIALDRFGGIEALALREVSVPPVGRGEILIRIEAAGVGKWDAFEREGGYAEMLDMQPTFPYVLGSEGAGTIAAVGEGVRHVKEGDRVYACGFLNPKGGFYAEYTVVDAGFAAPLPAALTAVQAAVMSGVGITALRGLDDTLALQRGETVMIYGASGGVGHLAVQLAKQMGARIFAVASGADGAALARRLGADVAIDGRSENVLAAARAFAPDGLDAVLLTAGAPKDIFAAVRFGSLVEWKYSGDVYGKWAALDKPMESLDNLRIGAAVIAAELHA
jgi:NADPH:quinone reductase-like Zn-dependent oxidoreductase